MLSLVAYGNSDDSGSESDNEQPDADNVSAKEVLLQNHKVPASIEEATEGRERKLPASPAKPENPISVGDKSAGTLSKEPGKLASLPSSQMTSINFDLKVLDKKRSQPIRITIPSLKELEKDEEANKKLKLKPSTKGSGLFSLLPEPKNVTSSVSKALMPQVITNAKKTQSKKLIPQKVKEIKPKSKIPEDDDEYEEEGKPLNSFFFSSNDDLPLPPLDMQLGVPMVSSDFTSSITAAHIPDMTQADDLSLQPPTDMVHSSSVINPNVTSNQPLPNEVEEASLDSTAILKLCGARDRRKGPDLSEIISISGSSLVGDSSLLLTKELSKEQPTHSFKRKSECSSLQRRKHQITYLAEQAKAQELELRNNWAQNRMTRKQTQAKYGF